MARARGPRLRLMPVLDSARVEPTRGTGLAVLIHQEGLTMKTLLRGLSILGLSLIAMSFVNGCSTTKEETTKTTTYVPATEVPAPVVVNPPPQVVVDRK